jgi:hypothetical protein
LSQLLADAGEAVYVVNFGQMGYVSTQEVIALFRACQQNDSPKVAVFYDGINDAGSSMQNLAAGLSINEVHRAEEFNLLKTNSLSAAADSLIRNSTLYRLLSPGSDSGKAILRSGQERWQALFAVELQKPRTQARVQAAIAAAKATDRTQQQRIAVRTALEGMDIPRQTAEVYYRNIHATKALGEKFGFESITFLQPVIFSKKRGSPEEERTRQMESEQSIFFEVVYGMIRQAPRPDGLLNDLSGLFNNDEWSARTTFIDFCHTNAEANRAVARAMLPYIQASLRRSQVKR